MNLRRIERRFKQLDPEWIKQLRRNFYPVDCEGMLTTYSDKLSSSYEFCFVGDIRAQLGLSRNYEYFIDDYPDSPTDDQCPYCTECASNMSESIDDDDEELYLTTLRKFATHLKRKHKKEIPK